MSKNPQGFTKSGRNLEWGSKTRKEEDRLRGNNNQARREAIETGLEQAACFWARGCSRPAVTTIYIQGWSEIPACATCARPHQQREERESHDYQRRVD
jgi:hypothetical protein